MKALELSEKLRREFVQVYDIDVRLRNLFEQVENLEQVVRPDVHNLLAHLARNLENRESEESLELHERARRVHVPRLVRGAHRLFELRQPDASLALDLRGQSAAGAVLEGGFLQELALDLYRALRVQQIRIDRSLRGLQRQLLQRHA